MNEATMNAMSYEELQVWALTNPTEALMHPDALPTPILACCAHKAPESALEFAGKRLSRFRYGKCMLACPALALKLGADLHIPDPRDGHSECHPYHATYQSYLLEKCALAAPKEALEYAGDRLPPALRQRCVELVGATK